MSLTKATYSMIQGAVANVLDFGAVGDWNGTTGTDDTAAINAAIASLGNNGGTVFFPTGRYKTTAKITVSTPVRIVGTGRGSNSNVHKCEIVKTGNYTALEFVPGAAWGGIEDIAIGTSNSAFTGDGLYISSGRIDVDRIAITNQGGKGLNIYDANCSNFSNVYIFNCAIGLYVEGVNPAPDVNGITFLNFDILSSRQDGIYIVNAIANTHVGMCIQGSVRYGIYITNGARNIFYGTYSENNGAGNSALVFGGGADFNYVEFTTADTLGTVTNPTGSNGWRVLGGNIVLANGEGIDFSQGTVNPGMTSTVLDAYEEGTWTPSFTSLTTSGTVNISATYTLVGRMCHCTVSIVGSGGGTSSAVLGTTRMAGLPFTPAGSDILSVLNANSLAPISQSLVVASSYLPTWTTLGNVLISFTYETT
jgi:hypothetical protein